MNKSIEKNEKMPEESEELFIERIKKELLEEKLDKLDNSDFINLDINIIGLEEAKLWDMFNNIKTKEDWDKAVKDFYIYRKKTVKEIEKEKERGEIKGAVLHGDIIIHPKGNFLSLLGNKLTGLSGKIK